MYLTTIRGPSRPGKRPPAAPGSAARFVARQHTPPGTFLQGRQEVTP